jgi:ligand-binding sensor domain-containing protein
MFFNGLCIILLVFPVCGRPNAAPVTSLTSNLIFDIQVFKDTLWAATGEGINKIWFTGDTLRTEGYTTVHGLGSGYPGTIITCAGRTFASTIDYNSNVYIGTGIAEFSPEGLSWVNTDFTWKDGNNVLKLGADAAAFDSVFYFAYIGGSLLKNNVRSDSGWQILIPDTSGLLPKEFSFSEFPPDTIKKQDNFPREFIVWSVAVDSITPDSCHIFIGTSNGIFYSPDRGISWREVPLPPLEVSAEVVISNTGREIRGIWVQQLDQGSAVWAAASENGDDSYLYQKRRFMRLSTLGGTWEQIGDLAGVSVNACSFIGTSGWIATERGLYTVKDGAVLREPEYFRNNDLLTTKCNTVAALIGSVGGSGDTVLWVGTENGLYYSKNAGRGWKPYRLEKAVSPGMKEVYAAPGVLRYNQDPVSFVYNLSQSAYTTITVYDWNMYKVKTIIDHVWREAGSQSVNRRSSDFIQDRWDGTNERGVPVAVGTYYFKIQSDAGEKGFGKIIVFR